MSRSYYSKETKKQKKQEFKKTLHEVIGIIEKMKKKKLDNKYEHKTKEEDYEFDEGKYTILSSTEFRR